MNVTFGVTGASEDPPDGHDARAHHRSLPPPAAGTMLERAPTRVVSSSTLSEGVLE